MRVGFGLPQVGSFANADSLTKVARRAEELGFSSVWVFDRLLCPLKPQVPYPIGDGSLPEGYRRVLDPLETLTFVAARTERVALGVSVLNLPWYNPALLARRLTSVDVLSGGRLCLGFGVGWLPDEYDAAGVPWNTRGKRADEMLSALKAWWTSDPVEVEGSFFKISKSYIGLKPIQKPHPPIYMAAFTPAAMKRAAREANGWFPVGVPLAAVGQMFESIRSMVEQAGRDAASFKLVVRGNIEFTDSPREGNRNDFTGSLDDIAKDVAAVKKLGAHELVLDVQFSPDVKSVDSMLRRMEDLRSIAL
jgi:probable F420-dependent oxidoreductase